MRSVAISVLLVKLIDINIRCGCFKKLFPSAYIFKYSLFPDIVSGNINFLKIGGKLEKRALISYGTLKSFCA